MHLANEICPSSNPRLPICRHCDAILEGTAPMRRFGMVLRLKPEATERYQEHHAAVWPEVLAMIRECNIRNYSIYLKDGYLFSYFEYVGSDLKSDWSKMAAHKKTQEWWSIMEPMQEPLATRKPGEWWAEMEEVFHME